MADIDTMTAGEEIDRIVAERVMGWTLSGTVYQCCDGTGWQYYDWLPSTKISDAWQVIERMWSLGWNVGLEDDRPVFGRWTCWLFKPPQWVYATADTVQLAICRAALRAMGSR